MFIARRTLLTVHLLVAVGALPQDIHLQRIGQVGGACRAQAVADGYAYIGVGSDFVVLDIANPSLPVEVARVSLDDTVNDIAVNSDRAVVATSAPFVWSGAKTAVIDIADPTHPLLLGAHASTYIVKALALHGDYCLAAKEDGRMDVLDVSPQDGPELLGTLATIYAADIAIQGDLALLAGGYGSLQVLDLSNLPTITPLSTYPTSTNYNAISADGDRVALARYQAVDVFSVSDPAHPSLLGTVPEVFVTYGVAMSGNVLYTGTQYEIHSIDISDLAKPVQLHKLYDGRVSSNFRFSLSDTSLYLCNYPVGFQIVDVSTPSFLYTRGRFDAGIAPIGVAVAGQMAGTGASSRGPNLLDVSDPEHPEMLGSAESSGGTRDIGWSNGRLFIAGFDGLAAWDVIGNEPRYGYLFLAQGCNTVEFNGKYAYINDQSAAFRVLDTSVPRTPAELGSVPLAGHSYSFGLTRTHAYVPYSSLKSYSIVDIGNPSSPTRVNEIATSDSISAIAATGNRIFIGYGTGDIKEYDVNIADSPSLLGAASVGSTASKLSIYANLLFTNPRFDGMVVFDISQRGAPRFLGRYKHKTYDFDVHGGLFYVVGGDRGLDLVRCTEALPPLPPPTRLQASDGEYGDKVRITWDKMAGAEAYDVWRLAPDAKAPVHLCTTNYTELHDSPLTSNTYTYWVTASFDGTASAASDPDTGFLTDPPPTALQVSPQRHSVSYDAGDVEFAIANIGNPELPFTWGAEAISGEWVHIQDAPSGKSAGICRVHFDANDTHLEREARIRITSPGAVDSPQEVTIVQGALPIPDDPWIRVTSPNGAERWSRGTAHAVRWEYTDNSGPSVRIELFRNGEWFRSVTAGTINDGKFKWAVPSDLPKGKNYSIRIVSLLDETVFDSSDSEFTIRKLAAP